MKLWVLIPAGGKLLGATTFVHHDRVEAIDQAVRLFKSGARFDVVEVDPVTVYRVQHDGKVKLVEL